MFSGSRDGQPQQGCEQQAHANPTLEASYHSSGGALLLQNGLLPEPAAGHLVAPATGGVGLKDTCIVLTSRRVTTVAVRAKLSHPAS